MDKQEEQRLITTVNALLDYDFQRAQDLRLPGYTRNDQTLYPSSLPYCGLRHLHERLTRESEVVDDNFGNQVYANIGQGVHWAYQRFMGACGNAVANWYCTGPYDDPHPEEIRELCTYPKHKCPQCGRPFKHRELKFQREAMTGKTDFLWLARTGDDAWGNLLFIVDVKSSDDDRILAQLEDSSVGHFPNRDHVFQMEAYVPMVEDQLERRVHGWILHYMGRNKPLKNQLKIIQLMNADDVQEARSRNDFYLEHHRLSLSVDHPKDQPYSPEAYQQLVATKPCKTRQDYDRNFHTFYNPCPLRDSCFNNRNLDKVMIPLLEARK